MKVLTLSDTLATGAPVAATIGMFDGVHLGHRSLINSLKHHSDGRTTAVVTFREHPARVLRPECAPPAIMSLSVKVADLEATGIHYLILLDFTPEVARLTSREFMALLHKRYGVDLIVMGFNHRFGHDRGKGFAHYVAAGRELGVTVVQAEEYKGEHAPVSSSRIRELIARGEVGEAAQCLGHPFAIEGTVAHGFHNGTAIGFPTANVATADPAVIVPHTGAYAVTVTIEGDDTVFKGMANIGSRPTLHNGDGERSIEVNIFGFNGDIYGCRLTIRFHAFMRPETDFGSLHALKQQLAADRTHALHLLATARQQQQSSTD